MRLLWLLKETDSVDEYLVVPYERRVQLELDGNTASSEDDLTRSLFAPVLDPDAESTMTMLVLRRAQRGGAQRYTSLFVFRQTYDWWAKVRDTAQERELELEALDDPDPILAPRRALLKRPSATRSRSVPPSECRHAPSADSEIRTCSVPGRPRRSCRNGSRFQEAL